MGPILPSRGPLSDPPGTARRRSTTPSLNEARDHLETLLQLGYYEGFCRDLRATRAALRAAYGPRRGDARLERLLAYFDRLAAATPEDDDLRALRFRFGFHRTAASLVGLAAMYRRVGEYARDAAYGRDDRAHEPPERRPGARPAARAYDSRRAFRRGELRDAR